MKKFSNTILMTVAIALIVVMPACRSNRKPAVVPTNTAATNTVPEVPDVPPTDTSERVAEQPDFVNPQVEEETIPSNIEDLNRWAQDKGYIRDAFYLYDEATLDDAAQSALGSSATWLKGNQGTTYNLLVEGHCDERGTEQYNLALGDRRANSARDYLMTLGVDGGRIRTVSYGEERPFEEGHDESSYAQNRRAHLVLVRPAR